MKIIHVPLITCLLGALILILCSATVGGLIVYIRISKQTSELKAKSQTIFVDSKQLFDLDNQLLTSYENMNTAFSTCSPTDSAKCDWNKIGVSVKKLGDTYNIISRPRDILLDKLSKDINSYMQTSH